MIHIFYMGALFLLTTSCAVGGNAKSVYGDAEAKGGNVTVNPNVRIDSPTTPDQAAQRAAELGAKQAAQQAAELGAKQAAQQAAELGAKQAAQQAAEQAARQSPRMACVDCVETGAGGDDIIPSLPGKKFEMSSTLRHPKDGIAQRVNVFFATDRNYNLSAKPNRQFGTERNLLRYGVAQVTIPLSHTTGVLETASVLNLQFTSSPDKHVIMENIEILDKSSYYRTISERLKNSKEKNALIFIHGYRVTFEDAARRTGQMAYDLNFKGVPVFFSWPSQGTLLGYWTDEDNVLWAAPHIRRFLADFLERSDAENVFLVAHSMGTRALTNAYTSLVNTKPDLLTKVKEIILAAPDINADIFRDQIAPEIFKEGTPTTLYASSDDWALWASGLMRGGYARAGDTSNNEVFIFPGVKSIDASNVKTELFGFGHSYFSNAKSILSDIFYIIHGHLHPDDRAGLRKVSTPQGTYWKFKL